LLIFYQCCACKNCFQTLFEKSCSTEFLSAWLSEFSFLQTYISEQEIFDNAGVDYIEPYLRETKEIIQQAKQHKPISVIKPTDISAIIHSHSKWSDGINTIEEMAKAAMAKGLQYLVISDHSKSAFYANGFNGRKDCCAA